MEAGGAIWEGPERLGEVWNTLSFTHTESEQLGLEKKVFAAAWGGPAFLLCCGKEDP